MLYFIGGSARCGKSTLFKKVRPLIQGQTLSIDIIKGTFAHFALSKETCLSLQEQHPLLVKPSEYTHTPEAWLAKLYERDRITWEGLKIFLNTAVDHNEEVLIEGCIWPDLLKELTHGHKAVFLVDTSLEQGTRLMEITKKADSNNWMKNWSDERLHLWGKFNAHRSSEIKRLAIENNYAVVDVLDGGIEEAQKKAYENLIGGIC